MGVEARVTAKDENFEKGSLIGAPLSGQVGGLMRLAAPRGEPIVLVVGDAAGNESQATAGPASRTVSAFAYAYYILTPKPCVHLLTPIDDAYRAFGDPLELSNASALFAFYSWPGGAQDIGPVHLSQKPPQGLFGGGRPDPVQPL